MRNKSASIEMRIKSGRYKNAFENITRKSRSVARITSHFYAYVLNTGQVQWPLRVKLLFSNYSIYLCILTNKINLPSHDTILGFFLNLYIQFKTNVHLGLGIFK